jgi:SAM-dependent methyltransferase
MVTRVVSVSVIRWIARRRNGSPTIPVGSCRFGDLRRLSPISGDYGFDRGTPVDRYYIERFLGDNSSDIAGHVLEIGDNVYTLRFGGDRIVASDILHVDASNARATLVGDVAQPGTLPKARFDCIVFTQTLHLVFDMRSAIANLHDALKPGGVLLVTAPGITQVDTGIWAKTWYWSVTAVGTSRLLQERFRPERIAVAAHGNVLAAAAFLYGLACEELDQTELDAEDPRYPVVIVARAVRADT